jgi:Kef-type K+ transport system membrane component KefB
VGIGVSPLLLIPLYFTYAGPPPASNVLTRNLVGILLCALLIVFLAGLSHLIRVAHAAYEWIASVIYGAGMTWVAVLLVGISLEVGAISGAPGGTLDPPIDGPLANGTMLIHGSIGRALTALILTAAGYAILRTRIFAVWIAAPPHHRAHQRDVHPVAVLRHRCGSVLQRGWMATALSSRASSATGAWRWASRC